MTRLALAGKCGGFGPEDEAGATPGDGTAARLCSWFNNHASAIPLSPPPTSHKKCRRVTGDGPLKGLKSWFTNYRGKNKPSRRSDEKIFAGSKTRTARGNSLNRLWPERRIGESVSV